MKFDEKLTEKCLIILDNLCKHPISEIFQHSVDPELDNAPDYNQVIKKPIDITTVKSKVESGTYKEFSEFKSDVEQIWENALIYNGNKSLTGFMALEMSKIFQREIKEIRELESDEWLVSFTKTKNKLNDLFKHQLKSLDDMSLSREYEMLIPDRKVSRPVLTLEDHRLFQDTFRFTDNPNYINKIIAILCENEQIDPNEEEYYINLNALNPRTLKALKDLIKDMK